LKQANGVVGAPQENSVHFPGIKPQEPEATLKFPDITASVPHPVNPVAGPGRPILGRFPQLPLRLRAHHPVHFHPEFILKQANGAIGALPEVSVDLSGIKPQIFQTTLQLVNVPPAGSLLEGSLSERSFRLGICQTVRIRRDAAQNRPCQHHQGATEQPLSSPHRLNPLSTLGFIRYYAEIPTAQFKRLAGQTGKKKGCRIVAAPFPSAYRIYPVPCLIHSPICSLRPGVSFNTPWQTRDP